MSTSNPNATTGLFLVDVSNQRKIVQLPLLSERPGRVITIKDKEHNCSEHSTIQIITSGFDTFDEGGGNSITLASPAAFVTLTAYYNPISGSHWYVTNIANPIGRFTVGEPGAKVDITAGLGFTNITQGGSNNATTSFIQRANDTSQSTLFELYTQAGAGTTLTTTDSNNNVVSLTLGSSAGSNSGIVLRDATSAQYTFSNATFKAPAIQSISASISSLSVSSVNGEPVVTSTILGSNVSTLEKLINDLPTGPTPLFSTINVSSLVSTSSITVTGDANICQISTGSILVSSITGSNITISTNTTTVLGNVGIGSLNSNFSLQVWDSNNGGTRENSTLMVVSGGDVKKGGSVCFGANLGNAPMAMIKGSHLNAYPFATPNGQDQGSLNFFTRPFNNQNYSDLILRMIIDQGGNVGIGQSNPSYTPSYTLDVSGTGNFSGSTIATTGSFSTILTSTVGINNSNPSYTLDVLGTGNFSGSTIATTGFFRTVQASTLIVTENANICQISTGSIFVSSITGSNITISTNTTTVLGNVGIGSLNSNFSLQVWDSNNGGARENSTLMVVSGGDIYYRGGSVCFGANLGNAPMAMIKGSILNAYPFATPNGQDQGSLNFFTRPSNTQNYSDLILRMIIDQGGNVGIGQSNPSYTPSYTLDVSGTGNFSGSTIATTGSFSTIFTSSVGINNSNPSYTLDVAGTGNFSGSTIATTGNFLGSTIATTGFFSTAQASTLIVTGDVTINTINADSNNIITLNSSTFTITGNVGTNGITQPPTYLTTSCDATGLTGLGVNTNDVWTVLGAVTNYFTTNAGSLQVTKLGGESIITSNPHDLAIMPLGGRTMIGNSTGQILLGLGNISVGINTINPSYTVDVSGTGNFTQSITTSSICVTGDANISVLNILSLITTSSINVTGNANISQISTGCLQVSSISSTTLSLNTASTLITGTVGINNSNPSYTLDVLGTGNFSGSTIATTGSFSTITTSSVTTGAVLALQTSTGSLQVSSISSGTLRLNTASTLITGNVGIGTATPSYTLDVTGTGRFTTSTIATTGSFSTILTSTSFTNFITASNLVTTSNLTVTSQANISQTSTGSLQVSSISSGTLRLNTASTIITGNVGIGIPAPAPAYTLDVNGTINANTAVIGGQYVKITGVPSSNFINGQGTYISWNNDNGGGATYFHNQIGSGSNYNGGYHFQNWTNSNTFYGEVMTLKNDGKVGIGAPNPITALDISAGQIHVAGNSNSNYIGQAGPGQGTYISFNDDNGSGRSYFGCQRGSGGGGFQFDIYDSNANLLTTPLVMVSFSNLNTGNAYSQVGIGVSASNIQGVLDVKVSPNNPAGLAVLRGDTQAGFANGLMSNVNESCACWPIPLTNDQSRVAIFWRSGGVNQQTTLGGGNYFTGQHANEITNSNITRSTISDYVGMIVSSADEGYVSWRAGQRITGSNAIWITETLPIIKLTDKDMDKAIWGVLTDHENDKFDGTDAILDTSSVWGTNIDSHQVRVNGLGEGAIWVTNINGNFENGDYICSSAIPGYGRRQDDDLLHNYTVAKITMSCDFNFSQSNYRCEELVHEGVTYKRAYVGCTYHCS